MSTLAPTRIRMEDLAGVAGHEVGPSRWLEVTQQRIDAFAASTDDRQWLHTDPVRAAGGRSGPRSLTACSRWRS